MNTLPDKPRKGTPVRIRRTVRPRKYASRTGWVATPNRDGEIGVTFTIGGDIDAWFTLDELEAQ